MDGPLQQGEASKRLPVYTTEQRRPGQGNPNGDPQTWEQAFINCYPEVYRNVTTPYEREFGVISRPGLGAGPTLSTTIASYGTGSAMECRDHIAISQGSYGSGASLIADQNVCAFYDSSAHDIYIIAYRPNAKTSVKIGTITTATATDTVFLTPIVQIVGGVQTPAVAVTYVKGGTTTSAGYYAVVSATTGLFTTSSLTSISSGSFPPNQSPALVLTGPFQQIDGVNYVMTTDGRLWGSGGAGGTIYDITSWNTNNVVQASQYPTGGIGCFRFKNVLLLICQDSIEFFVDAGGPPPASPLQRTDQAFIKFGAMSPKLICNVNDTIYWVAYGGSDVTGIWMLDGYTPTKISTPKIDYCLATNFSGGSIPKPTNTLVVMNFNHKLHLVANLGSIGYSNTGYYDTGTIFSNLDSFPVNPTQELGTGVVAYNMDDKIWWGLSVNDGTGNLAFLAPAVEFPVAGSAQTFYNQLVFCTSAAGSLSGIGSTLLYEFVNIGANGSYVDTFTAPNPVCCSVQLNTYWFGTEKRKSIRKIKAIVNRISQVSGDMNSYVMYICYTRDDNSVTNGPQFGRQVALPGVNSRYYISQCGMARSISVLIVCKSVSAFRLLGVELDLDQGTS